MSSAAAAAAVPPNDPVPVKEQKEAMEAPNGASVDPNVANIAMRLQKKYGQERDKRMADDKARQYIDLESSAKFKHFSDDPWLDERSEKVILQDGDRTKFLIIGGGFGGILYGCRLSKAGIKAADIKLVDVAGGLGGTWYWNRYPGLMCDVESYIYLPMLEEMGYMPKHKFSYGPEILSYLNALAQKYGLADQAMFRTKINTMDWDDQHKEWSVNMTKERKGDKSLNLTVRSQFVMLAAGVLQHPKLPNIPGIDTFQGHSFHTSRWDYAYTGGDPTTPVLDGLRGKRVGILGTGATAIQAVPHLAKYAKELIVFQRTPSQVDTRDQRETDPEWWKKEIHGREGWQRDRIANFNGHLTNTLSPDAPNLVNDGWTKMTAYRALIGGPGDVKMEDIPAYVAELHTRDIPRAERLRARCDEVVKDKDTAEKLKSWYPSWCKRPCFHDDYLKTFNLAHVKLVDTDGQGISSLTEKGPVFEGKEYPLDVLIWGTGFRAPATGSPAKMANMTVTGRNGLSMNDKWTENLSTLHGIVSRDFPNFFYTGPWQTAASANFMNVLDTLISHGVHIVTEAEKHASATKAGVRYSLEPTAAAEEQWTRQIMMRAAKSAGVSGCTPSYFNREGQVDRLPMETKMKMARMGIYGDGILKFQELLEEWRSGDKFKDLDVNTEVGK